MYVYLIPTYCGERTWYHGNVECAFATSPLLLGIFNEVTPLLQDSSTPQSDHQTCPLPIMIKTKKKKTCNVRKKIICAISTRDYVLKNIMNLRISISKGVKTFGFTATCPY